MPRTAKLEFSLCENDKRGGIMLEAFHAFYSENQVFFFVETMLLLFGLYCILNPYPVTPPQKRMLPRELKKTRIYGIVFFAFALVVLAINFGLYLH